MANNGFIAGAWNYVEPNRESTIVIAQYGNELMGNWIIDNGWFAKGAMKDGDIADMIFEDHSGNKYEFTGGTSSSDGKKIKWSNNTHWERQTPIVNG